MTALEGSDLKCEGQLRGGPGVPRLAATVGYAAHSGQPFRYDLSNGYRQRRGRMSAMTGPSRPSGIE